MVKKAASINLVKTDKNQTINQLVNWALGAGRVLIIVVELIALSAFLYRFILDSQLRGVHEKIKQEQAIILAEKKNEELYTNVQERISLASSLLDNASKNTKVFKDILGFAQPGMTLTNVNLLETGIRISASISSVYPLATFINSLKNYEPVESVSIDKIENKTANAVINVSISVALKSKEAQNANSGN